MGTHCCSQELDNYQIKVQKVEIIEKEQRNGLPSTKIGIKMCDLGNYTKEINVKEINKMVFKVAEKQKKFKIPFRINRQHIPENKLSQPYYIPSLDLFYVGQWVYDAKIYDNVPGGIGRLYENNAISQGCFKTIFLNSQQIEALRQMERTDVQYNLSQAKSLQNNNESEINQFPKKELQLAGFSSAYKNTKNTKDESYLKLEKKLKAGQEKEVNDMEFVIKLHGQGRVCENQEEDEEQIEMQGDFYEGLLNGKGTLKITHKGIQTYSYTGSWKKGQKHGKGLQKLPNYKYEGDFYENQKQGKGVQTFIGSIKDEREVEKDINKMQRKLKNEGESMKIQTLKIVAVRQHREKIIKQELDITFPNSQIEFILERSLILDSSFIMERSNRTNFTQSYSGDFHKGKMQGSGTYIWTGGKTFKGKWQQSKLNGKGEFYWPDGSYFQGTYVDDQRHGEGTMVWSVTKRYRGSWAFGHRHGYGQSIEIQEKSAVMTVKGSIWDKDKVKKKLFQKTVSLPNFNQINQIQDFIEEQLNGVRNKGKKKQNSSSLQLLSLKNINENHLINEFEQELGKIGFD